MKRILKTTCTAVALIGFATGSAMAGDAIDEQRAQAPVLGGEAEVMEDEKGDYAPDEVTNIDQTKPVVEGVETGDRAISDELAEGDGAIGAVDGENEVLDDEKGDYAADEVTNLDQTKPVVAGVETGDAVAPEELAEEMDMDRGDPSEEGIVGIDQKKPRVEGTETNVESPAID